MRAKKRDLAHNFAKSFNFLHFGYFSPAKMCGGRGDVGRRGFDGERGLDRGLCCGGVLEVAGAECDGALN